MNVERLDVSLAGGAALDVVWTARRATSGPTRSGRVAARMRSARPGGHDAAVEACAAAFDAVASDIARSLRDDDLARR